jgi:hypothetical protein
VAPTVARYVLSLSGYRQYQGFEKRMLLNRLCEDEQ